LPARQQHYYGCKRSRGKQSATITARSVMRGDRGRCDDDSDDDDE
jgi:hypothetical protein